MARRRLEVEIVGDASKLDKAFRSAERSSRQFGRNVGKSGGLAGGLLSGVGKGGMIGAGIAAGTGVALVGLKKVVAAAKEAQVAQAQLDQAFAASGKSSVKFGAQVDRSIRSISKMAAFDDEDVSSAFASLLRTTGSIEKATRGAALAANIARARRISLAAATKIVEKAENGQLRGLKAIGVQLDSNTTTTEALERAQQKFAGSAAAYGKTAAGAQEKLGVAFENLEEKVGAKLLPTLTKLTLKLVELIDWSEKNWPRFAKAVEDAYRKVKPIIDSQLALFKGVGNAVAGMVRIVHGLFTGDWAEAWKGFKQYAVDGVGGVIKAVLSLPLKLGKAVAQSMFAGMEKAFTAALNKIISVINKAIGAYNAIPLLPNVGKVPAVGGSSSPKGPVATTPSYQGTSPGGRNTPRTAAQTVNLVVDKRVLASVVLGEASKQSKQSAMSTSGRTPGYRPF
jgi:hypothetical protein